MSPQQRSRAMSHVRSNNTRIEQLVGTRLHKRGLRYKKCVLVLPGRPDIVFPKYKAAIFIHGCFWHGHFACKRSHLPESNRNFWEKKISATAKRDGEKIVQLRNNGWRVAIVWQCCLSNNDSITNTIDILVEWIMHGNDRLEIPEFL